ncbi:NAD(P)-binding protein [Stemphylium lycopersici]|nr:short chain dehydrogenase reductase family [Stemphylium lycopersici]RAR10088.1 NAD(P)-binding protein [Stemphylium lycopersici]
MPGSTPAKPVDCTIDFDPSSLIDKTAVVTGGASGLGEAYVRALINAGAKVCFGDRDIQRGEGLASSLEKCSFVPCDVTNWDDQVRLFSKAGSLSLSGKIDYVVANAGIVHADDVFTFDGPFAKKPTLSIIDVNLKGALYTAKLAMHHFILQNGATPSATQSDTCLILIGSGAAYLDCPRGPQYSASKYAMRGIMHSLRRTAYYYGSRVNMISPWYRCGEGGRASCDGGGCRGVFTENIE